MLKFIGKRLAYGLVAMFIIATLTFFLVHAIPGDPMSAKANMLPPEAFENFRIKYGLDKPVLEQYLIYIKNLLKGDLGDSLIYIGRSVNDVIKEHAPVSGLLSIPAVILQVLIGVSLGVIAAFFRNRLPDKIILVLVIVGVCVPSFVISSLLQYSFSIKYKMLPVYGWGNIKHFILPVTAMVIGGLAGYAKYMRNSTLGVISEDYILVARSKGISKMNLIINYILRNALIPIVTMIPPAIAFIFAGSFIIESIFGIPGLGKYFVSAVNDLDYPMIMGLTVFISFLYIVSLIVVDILYGLVDPRIRVAKGSR